MFQLETELEKIVRSIESNYQPDKIILFGSLAEGKVTVGSDIDLVVIKETEKDPWSEEVDRLIQHTQIHRLITRCCVAAGMLLLRRERSPTRRSGFQPRLVR
jgi:predicted nucleotidyltransferase